MAINTEWLWTPFDQGADGAKFNKGDMSPEAYQQELSFYAQLVAEHQVHILAVSEIENEQVAQELAVALGNKWRAYFVQGRDTATGQDVAILSRLDYVQDSLTSFDFPSGQLPGERKKKRLSKLVSARFYHPNTNETVGVLTSHFLSKRNDSAKKAKNRLRQAYALRKAFDVLRSNSDSVIVLGDFNDYRGSPVLTVLGRGLLNAFSHCESDVQHPYRASIDHILFSELTCRLSKSVDLRHHSDHRAVFAQFR